MNFFFWFIFSFFMFWIAFLFCALVLLLFLCEFVVVFISFCLIEQKVAVNYSEVWIVVCWFVCIYRVIWVVGLHWMLDLVFICWISLYAFSHLKEFSLLFGWWVNEGKDRKEKGGFFFSCVCFMKMIDQLKVSACSTWHNKQEILYLLIHILSSKLRVIGFRLHDSIKA